MDRPWAWNGTGVNCCSLLLASGPQQEKEGAMKQVSSWPCSQGPSLELPTALPPRRSSHYLISHLRRLRGPKVRGAGELCLCTEMGLVRVPGGGESPPSHPMPTIELSIRPGQTYAPPPNLETPAKAQMFSVKLPSLSTRHEEPPGPRGHASHAAGTVETPFRVRGNRASHFLC